MSIIKKYKIQLIETTVLSFLFFIKAIIYNHLIQNGSVSLKLSFVSLIYIIFIIALSYILKDKKRDIALLIIYSIISFIMFADAGYFTYFNQLTSVVVLKQVNQLGTIGESINYVLKPVNFLLVMDILPLILYYLYTRKLTPFKNLYNPEKRKVFTIVSGAFVLVISSVLIVNGLDEDINLSRQEFFTYHISDIYNTFFRESYVDNIDDFMKNASSSTVNKDKKYYGIGKDRNVITIQVEGLQNFVINRKYNGKEITPNLNKLINEDSIYFDRYYQQLGRGNTSDSEFVSHNSIYPAMDGQTYLMYYNNTYYGLPWILKDRGYTTAAYHGYKPEFWNRDKAYPYQGFDRFYSQNDYSITEPVIGFGINDREFFKQSISYMKATQEPYYAFLVTLSSHHPFTMPDEYKEIQLMDNHENTLLGNYIQSINYADAAIGEFIEDLKREGLYENTVINIYGDHFAISSMDEDNKRLMTEYLGYDYDFDEMMKIPLIIHVPGSNVYEKISVTGGQIDFLPTVLNILGLENKKGVMLGQDLVNATEGFVAQQTYMLKGSYIKDDVVFSMSRDGIFKNSRAWNPNTRQPIELEACREDYERAIKEINNSNHILKNDLLKKFIEEREGLSNEEEKVDTRVLPEALISHAGARIEELSYTNSKEAIDKSYENGYRFIELDFEWTTDGNLALIHDWDSYVNSAFSVESKMYSTEEFKGFKMIKGLTQMVLEDLAEWLYEHDDVYIVTDIKRDNVEALKLIRDRYPDLIHQFIPQIYGIDQFIPVQGLGYTNIILTLYASNYTDEELIDFVNRHEIFAITMPISKARTELPNKLKNANIFVYAHTINREDLRQELEANGVDGFYTDDLLP